MYYRLQEQIEPLMALKRYPETLEAEGNAALLHRPMVSIIGSRSPNPYTRSFTHQLAAALAKAGLVVVSGAAMGVDAIAHTGAGASQTIAVLPCGIDVDYPVINRNVLHQIRKEGLCLSQFERGFKATPWSFVVRNEIVVALGEVLIVTQADLNSGSMRSVAYAQRMGKKIYVLPHRLHESEGTNMLLAYGQAEAIFDIDAFVASFGVKGCGTDTLEDDFLNFCMKMPTYEEATIRYGHRLFEAELEGVVEIHNGRVLIATR
ncbi:MAG: DNA-processing protein DprA [Campylobacterales bacterium]|nr:DNA-processing protein DprA [Campylobacterales bacterium]